MKKILFAIFSIFLICLLYPNLAMAETRVAKYVVLDDSSGLEYFFVKDSTDTDTSTAIDLWPGKSLDPDFANIVIEHWASGVSSKDSTYFKLRFYQSDRDAESALLDSTWVLKDSITNTDGTNFGKHHLNKLANLIPAKNLMITAVGTDGKTHPAGIKVYVIVRVRYDK